MDDLVAITCPRSQRPAAERFYRPCTACPDELPARVGGEQREVQTAGYEPKLNVVPNHVATKD